MTPRRSALRVLVPMGLAVLVVMLAVLQYRWLGQVSDAERQELRASLERRSREFADAVDRELGTLQSTARNADESVAGGLAVGLSHALARWRTTTTFPGLVGAAYVAHLEQGAYVLQRLDESRQAVEAVPWPDELAAVKQRLPPHEVGLTRGTPPATQIFTYGGPAFVSDVPALVVWLPNRLAYTPGERSASSTFVTPAPVFDLPLVEQAVILQIDATYLTQTLLPTLMQRHFGSDQFRLQVLDAHGRTVATQGLTSGGTIVAASADITTPFLTPRLGIVDNMPGDRMFTFAINGARVDAPFKTDSRMAVRIERQEMSADVLTIGADDRWRLLVQHQAGSLDRAVAQARLRNTYLSFGILSVLAVAVGLVLVAARRSERLAAQQMEFVATVSHELRTPLAVIRSAAENLSAGVVHDPAQARRYGSLIEAEGRRLTDMVEQVLEHAGVNAAKRPLQLSELNPSQIARESANACASTAEQAGCELDLTLDTTLPFVRADEASLRRAIDNLIVNALKHAGSGRWVGVTTRAVTDDEGSAVEIEVADRGPGIDAADRPHIFEPFYRGRATVDRQVHGSGLGLSLVRQAMEAMGAAVRVEDRAGGGAAFVIRLRAIDEPLREMVAQRAVT